MTCVCCFSVSEQRFEVRKSAQTREKVSSRVRVFPLHFQLELNIEVAVTMHNLRLASHKLPVPSLTNYIHSKRINKNFHCYNRINAYSLFLKHDFHDALSVCWVKVVYGKILEILIFVISVTSKLFYNLPFCFIAISHLPLMSSHLR